MSGKASSSQLSSGLSGSGALSHVYIPYLPLRCNVPGSRGLFYDDGNKLLLSPASDQVFCWKTVPFDPMVAPTSDSLTEGPIVSIRYSLDLKFIAVQRSDQEIQFWDRGSGETFSQRCKSESESILGFFWTDCPLCDIVFVKTSGLDLFAYNSESKSLQLVETRKLNVNWYVYTHESRLVLLASGMQCKTFTGFQLSSAGIIRLPKFEMAMAKSEANNKPVLAAEDIFIVTVYGRIYCLQVDRIAMLLHSYRFYRDVVVQQGSLPIYSSKVAVSVVDNVLLVHQVDAKVVILYDIYADSRAPISAPLPLLFRGFPRSNSSSLRSNREDTESSEVNISDHEAIIYGDDWTFLVPDLIFSVSNQLLWKIHLDLEAISASSSEVPSVLEFLQRRKLEASKAKQLCLSIARTVILERRPVSTVARAIDVLVSSYSHSIKTGNYLKGTKAGKTLPSGMPHTTGPKLSADSSASRVDAIGKSIKYESSAGVDSESPNRFLTFSNSDSEEDASFFDSKIDRGKLTGAETSVSEARSSLVNNPLDANLSEQQESQLTSPAISPDEMYSFVFAPVEEEMVGEPSYLVAIIVEFLRSANLEKVEVRPNLYVLTIQLLARSERYAELGLFVLNKILEPSKEVAMQLLESGRQNSRTRKLGLDMLRQLSLHEDYVLLLVQEGYYLEALRYARKYKVNTVRASLFLEAAFISNDSQHLAAVLRFFTDFIPGFRDTSDHNTYYRILSEMNSYIAA
ncbi:putative colon cancer-associated Mic1, WD40/YVTN repeat-like-containing domain-containing protein [Rosa chinensis]|uniref:Putative colon cancer-associated Mic1, WD40/YVTN repeat-like-containing domain-containing protein n=1 Tax=Rosa chinensis TaxID=74649 RepID=A0A2P6RDC6_ROSCH|nr:regulator of MON1-CCZ1 complex isoform X1 [Rosa chinensis]XP_024187916.1 regulator of MON1-CCZ1 complex isoform X1 [Rosa chinensis]XP_024187917.1 regulator of MON1-CCZ1 complex isoform X1 [Rosa chinensis]XP_024187919.1 regulator of MON1-CCZ1 complex isoform X1 [Rosa chinensis]PRQ44424.1 putative colon cancer-associated Mic1, WD40/YVTN repeat-like-containing domain-containing protein [Rosa chinensis]